MPNYKKHIIFGLFFTLAVIIADSLWIHTGLVKFDLRFLLVYSPIILFSTILPDIDHRLSKPTFIAVALLLIVALYFLFMGNITSAIISIVIIMIIWILPFVSKGWSHRGHAHSIIFILLMSCLVWVFFNLSLGVVFFFGALSHLIADVEIKLW